MQPSIRNNRGIPNARGAPPRVRFRSKQRIPTSAKSPSPHPTIHPRDSKTTCFFWCLYLIAQRYVRIDTDPPNRKASLASQGTLFRVDVFVCKHKYLKCCKSAGFAPVNSPQGGSRNAPPSTPQRSPNDLGQDYSYMCVVGEDK